MAAAGVHRVCGCRHEQRPEAHPPLALWVTGPARLDEVADRAAAIVGTRAATAYGEHVAAELAAGLAERDVAVVSGGAYGIDGAAHRAALAADGFTVAVLAGGIDVSYPAGHAALFHRIGEQGLLVTEYPPGLRPAAAPVPDPQPSRRRAFAGRPWSSRRALAAARPTPRRGRGRWAAGCARCPVRSPRRRLSGAMCCCGPARPSSPAPTRSWNWSGMRASWRPTPSGRRRRWTDSADNELRVYDALPARGARTADEIAVASGLPPTQVLGPLSMLEIAGLVVCQGGRWKLALR